jgi:CHAD domain-containing protein
MGNPSPSYEDLHSVRVVAKRLRYAMEVFAECFAAPFREQLYPRIAELQEILGVVCDAHVNLARTEGLCRGLRSLVPSRSARWNESLENFVADMKLSRMQGREQFETWKNRANQTGFETLLHTLLAGSTASVPISTYPFVQAS